MNIGPMFENYAELLETPLPTAAMYKRDLLTAGLLTVGGRGRGAPHATSRDAAIALLALVASPRPSTAARYVKDFGGLKCVEGPEVDEDDALLQWLALPPRHTLADALSRLIDLTGSGEAATIIAHDLGLRLLSGEGDQDFKILILDTLLVATITVGHLHYKYDYRPEIGVNASDVERFYRRPIQSSKALGSDVLFRAGEAIHGQDFRKLVFAAALEMADEEGDETLDDRAEAEVGG